MARARLPIKNTLSTFSHLLRVSLRAAIAQVGAIASTHPARRLRDRALPHRPETRPRPCLGCRGGNVEACAAVLPVQPLPRSPLSAASDMLRNDSRVPTLLARE